MSFDTNIIKSIEIFVALVETGKTTVAAEVMGLSQSAVSQHLSLLERTFDVTIFDRSVRPLQLTPAGTLLHRHALRILGGVEDLVTDMRHQGARPISHLRVGIQASIATTLTPDLVALAKADFGVEDMTIHAGQSKDHEGLLRTRKADLVITSDPLYDLDGLERHPIMTESFLLVLPQSYIGPTGSIGELLEHLPLIRFAATTNVGRLTEQHLRRLKVRAPRVIQADRSSMVTACVARGMGFTFLTPSLLIDGFVEKMPLNIRPLPITGFSRSITLLARDRELGKLPVAFAAMTKKVLAQQVARQMGPAGINAIQFSQVQE
ncbi:LysR family transcriptional regulator [Roseovarius sp. Pro17]|uniref:LysR family transcriptional regulator n=1 Tax=Roseovarius sp. Pro17 TaxID=3108175 RepID=UPI002D77F3C8|nr:LysR family transcriptional regulator [Roseovarius sp. Pro17]